MNIIRPSNAYGPGQLLYRILPRAVWCALNGEKLPLEGAGSVKKSYIHAQDLARAIFLICEKAPLGETFNAGPEQPSTIRSLVELVADEVGIPFNQLVEITPARASEDTQYWLDSTKIKNTLGWEPELDLRNGVKDLVAWGRKYLDQLPRPSGFVLRA